MRVAVLNGSPKGEASVTLQSLRYLEKRFPHVEFAYHAVAQRVARFEREPGEIDVLIEALASADLIVWAFPLYYMLVHSGYKRFVELLFEHDAAARLRGTHASAVSTSIHFYDHTAHNYIRAVSEDLGLRYLEGLPAAMHDIMEPAGRARLETWFDSTMIGVEADVTPTRAFAAPERFAWEYRPATDPSVAPGGAADDRADSGVVRHDARRPTDGPSVAIVADRSAANVAAMVERLASRFSDVRVVDLAAMRFRPCLGCLKCGFDNVCAYEGSKDEFVEVYRTDVLTADAVVFASAVRDRHLTSITQRYFERTFVTTHQPLIAGKQVAYLVSGPLAANLNTREILLAYAEVMQASLVGIVTDEAAAAVNDASILDQQIDRLALEIERAVETKAAPRLTFRGVAGMRLFRDEIYGGLRFVFQRDHRYYRRHGIYDFPQRRIGARLWATAMTLLTRVPFMRREIRDRLKKEMVAPALRVVERATPRAAVLR